METAEQNRILNNLARNPGNFYTTMKTKDYRALLLVTDGTMMAQGRLWDIIGKSLGAGVYRVTTRRSKTF